MIPPPFHLLCRFTAAVALSGSLIFGVNAAQITVPDYELQPNAADQVIEIHIAGGESISGLDLFVQIGDGGPELELVGLPRGTSGPHISHVELIQGTIFDGVKDQPTDIGVSELTQAAFYTLALVGTVPTVPADGTLVRLTLDTTGLYHGQWDLKLSDVLPFDEFGGPYTTNLAGIAADIRNGSLTIPVSVGDYNDNQQLDVGDINLLSEQIRSELHPPAFDLTEDGLVNTDDLVFWVERVLRTHIGDSNLNGRFGSEDLVDVFRLGEYDDGVAENSTWPSGDWNGDGEFDSGDLVLAFQRGGYDELGVEPALALVPEPATWTGLLLGMLLIGLKRRHSIG